MAINTGYATTNSPFLNNVKPSSQKYGYLKGKYGLVNDVAPMKYKNKFIVANSEQNNNRFVSSNPYSVMDKVTFTLII